MYQEIKKHWNQSNQNKKLNKGNKLYGREETHYFLYNIWEKIKLKHTSIKINVI